MNRLRGLIARGALFSLLASFLVVALPAENASASQVTIHGHAVLPDGTGIDHLTMVFIPSYSNTYIYPTIDSSTGDFSFIASPGSGELWMATGGYGNNCPNLLLTGATLPLESSSVLPACFRSFASIIVRDDNMVNFGYSTWQSAANAQLIFPRVHTISLHVVDASTNSSVPYAGVAAGSRDRYLSLANFVNNHPDNGSNALNAPTWIPFGNSHFTDTGTVITDANGDISIKAFEAAIIYAPNGAQNSLSLDFTAEDPLDSTHTASTGMSTILSSSSNTLTLPAVERVSGNIHLASGTPVGNALMQFVPDGFSPDNRRIFQSDSSGNYAFNASFGAGTLDIFGTKTCSLFSKNGAPALTVSLPRCSTLQIPVVIGQDHTVRVVGNLVDSAASSSFDIELPNISEPTLSVRNYSDSSTVGSALIQSNSMWAATSVSILGTTQHLIWGLPETTVRTDSHGDITLRVWNGAVGGFANNSQITETNTIALIAADPNLLTRTESATISSFSSATIEFALRETVEVSGFVTIMDGTPVGNVVMGYVPGMGINQFGGYALLGSPTFNGFRFSRSVVADGTGHFAFQATPGAGALIMISGSNDIVTCTPPNTISHTLTAHDTATVEVTACTQYMKAIEIGADGMILDKEFQMYVGFPGETDTVHMILPNPSRLTFQVQDELTGEPVPDTVVTFWGGNELGKNLNSLTRNQHFKTAPFGNQEWRTNSEGLLTIPFFAAQWDQTASIHLEDPNLNVRYARVDIDRMTGDETRTVSLPDAPLPPETATATTDAGNDSTVSLDWTLPTNDGGAEITDYIVTAEQDTSIPSLRVAPTVKFTIRSTLGHGAAVISSAPTITHTLHSASLQHLSDTISGLLSGVTYKFTVRAVNRVGTSLPKLATKTVRTSNNGGGGGGGGFAPPPALSTDVTLKVFTVNGNAATSGSKIDVAAGVTSVAVIATPTDSGAKAVVSGANNLSTGDNTITVTVTAADGSTKKVYSITVNVAMAAPQPNPTPVVVIAPAPQPTPAPAESAVPAPKPTPTEAAKSSVTKLSLAKPATTAAKAPTTSMVLGQKVDVTVKGLPKSSSFTATVTFNGKQSKAGTIKSSSSGTLIFSSFKPAKAGTYTVALTLKSGAKFYFKVTVKARK